MIHKVSIKVPPLCLLGFLFALVSYMTVTKYMSMVQNTAAEDPGMARLYFFWFFPALLTNCQNARHQQSAASQSTTVKLDCTSYEQSTSTVALVETTTDSFY